MKKTRIVTMAAALAVLMAAPAVAAGPTVPIKPAQLARGEDSTVPRMQHDRVIVDGDTKIRLKRPGYLLGASGEQYVVASWPRLVRVSADGSTERILRYAANADPTLSADGDHILLTRILREDAIIRAVDSRSGKQVAKRRFDGYVAPLDSSEGRTVLTGTQPDRTLWWNFVNGGTKRINGRAGGAASITANRLTTFTGDPYEGGCAVVSPLRHPRRTLWRSCEDAAVGFSPNGRRMVTVDIQADGLGPGAITARHTKGGKTIATYTAYWFSSWTWESDKALILDAHTRKKVATVRCEAAECERASGIRRSSPRH